MKWTNKQKNSTLCLVSALLFLGSPIVRVNFTFSMMQQEISQAYRESISDLSTKEKTALNMVNVANRWIKDNPSLNQFEDMARQMKETQTIQEKLKLEALLDQAFLLACEEVEKIEMNSKDQNLYYGLKAEYLSIHTILMRSDGQKKADQLLKQVQSGLPSLIYKWANSPLEYSRRENLR